MGWVGAACDATSTSGETGAEAFGETRFADARALGREARARLDRGVTVGGEVVIQARGSEGIPVRDGADVGEGKREVVLEIEYETRSGVAADDAYFLCPGPSRRPSSWFPCVERGDVLTMFDFSVRAPRDWQVIASAHWDRVEKTRDADEDDPDGFRLTHHFTGMYPTLAHDMRLICGAFTAVSSPIKGVTLFAPAEGGFEERMEVAAAGVGKAIVAYEEYLGHPYPVSCLNIVFLPDSRTSERDALGACVNMHSTKWLVDPSLNTALLDARVHLATAIARQWFGGIVLPADTTDCWVVEGLAEYLAGMYVKSLTGFNELSYRRMKDMRLAAEIDDGEQLPPLASRASRIWRSGHYAGPDPAAGGAPRPLAAHVERALRAKAVSVMHMLEKRLGPDVLQKVLKYFAGLHVRRNKKEQNTRAGPSAEVLASNARWIHTLQLFDHCRATVNLGKGEVNSFLERWVYGAGIPKLSVGYVVKRKKNVMEFAVKLEGSAAAAAADRAALAVARNHRSSVTVRMREEQRPDANDHVVSLGQSSWQLMEIPLQPRPKDRRPKTIIESGGDPELIAAMECPVRYVRVDPEFEWMGNIEQSVKQVGLESMMAQMLEKEKDIVAQIVAVEFLGRRVANGSVSAVLVLDKCLNSEDTFCRVREEAAMALGKSASAKTQWGGLHALLRHYKRFQCDENTGKPKQNDFRDLSKLLVDQAVITALSYVYDEDAKCTHADAIEAIVSRLKHNDNEGNPQSDDSFIATCISALARCAPANMKQLGAMTSEIHYYMRRDGRFPSAELCVSCAGIRALGLIASTVDLKECLEDAERAARLGFSVGAESTILAATDAMMYVTFARTKNELEALKYVLEHSASHPSATQSAMLWSACQYVSTFIGSDSLKGVSADILNLLRDRMASNDADVASAAYAIAFVLASRDSSLCEIQDSIAEAMKRAGDQIPVGLDVHVHPDHEPLNEEKRAEKEAKRARKRERERARQAAREAQEAEYAAQRRIDAEAAFVEQQAEHVSDDKTTGTGTVLASEGADAEPKEGTPIGGGLKRAHEENPSVKSFVETAAAEEAPAEPAPKKLKLSFKLKKPT